MMCDLLMADLYKEFRKKSFKVLVLLVMFVSIFSLVIINKNIDLRSGEVTSYSLFSEEEYKSVNKYGDYQHYVREYDSYVEDINIVKELNSRNVVSNLQFLLSYSHNFLFVLGIVIVFLSFHSFSYDFQKDTIKYVFMSRHGRRKIYFSKLLSIFILSFFLFSVMLITMILTSGILTGENIFAIKIWVNNNGYFKEVLYILDFLKNSFIYFAPYLFMIVFSMFLSIVLKGNNFGLVISLVIYFASLMFSQVLFNFGFMLIKYTFLPYIDFTYLTDKSLVLFNNLIYNLDFSYGYSIFILGIYSMLFVDLSLWFLKRDV